MPEAEKKCCANRCEHVSSSRWRPELGATEKWWVCCRCGRRRNEFIRASGTGIWTERPSDHGPHHPAKTTQPYWRGWHPRATQEG